MCVDVFISDGEIKDLIYVLPGELEDFDTPCIHCFGDCSECEEFQFMHVPGSEVYPEPEGE